MIPIYCMEEHHEAFYYWGAAIAQGYLKAEGNTLFHVDHHDDLECGGYFHDFTKVISDLQERRQVTLWELGIADFIVPALYEGIFGQMYNMKGLREMPFSTEERFVKRIGAHTLSINTYIPFLHAGHRREGKEEYRFFTYHEGSLSNTGKLENVVLDIDLDYFCWDDSLSDVPPKRIEITKEAYEEYQSNYCHPFRILPRRLLKAEAEKGHYYLRYEEPVVEEKAADEERIRKRITRFMQWLQVQEWKPSVITLCRSAHSGYLPTTYAGLVEKLVHGGLGELYELEEQERIKW